MYQIDETHSPELTSWVESANTSETDFPIQNLPFGRFRHAEAGQTWRIGVAIGENVLDLRAVGLVSTDDMNELLAMPLAERRTLRRRLSDGLRWGSASKASWQEALWPLKDCELGLPTRIGNYTDFYVGIHHATAVGRLFRPDSPLMPNYKWVPIGYHGRASSLVPHETSIRRPKGQIAGAAGPSLAPSQKLDFELELGFVIGRGNELGAPIPISAAEEHMYGVTLLNDWSARDIQAWEYQPLGPFLAKNFGSTMSPWIVTMEALAPFRAPFERPDSDPDPLPYLDDEINRAQGQLDIHLEVFLQTEAMRAAGLAPAKISRSNSAQAAYWTPAQLLTHHTVNGCNLQPGDLLGSGTLSGKDPSQAGSLVELTLGGKNEIRLPNGEVRMFLQDGDTLSLSAYCSREGARRIGFGLCSGTITAAIAP